MADYKHILVTGAAGFIGCELSLKLLDSGCRVVGIDNLNDYYDVSLKQDRLKRLDGFEQFEFIKLDMSDRDAMNELFGKHQFDVVINLAAQAGVRYSLENPAAYVDSNLVGFGNVLEGCHQTQVKHLVFASSSSVYGANTKIPFSESDNVDHPVSLYAATKKSNELMAHSYANLYDLPCTGLRFFTVYGPWGRPDMAYFSFTRKILADEPIPVFNHGDMMRDFTYIDDVIDGVMEIISKPPESDNSWDGDKPNPATSYAPYRVYNIGNNEPCKLLEFIEVLENCLGKKANKDMMPMQPGDVQTTYANIDALQGIANFSPKCSLSEGLQQFVAWYQEYYR